MRDRFRLEQLLRELVVPAALLFAAVGSSAEPPKKEYDPHITYVFPAGGQRGTTIETMIRGRGLEGASQVRVSGRGVTAKILAIEKPSTRLRQRSKNRLDQSENPNVVRVSVTIAADAELGQRDLRIVTPKGVTNRYRFIVGQIPEINEVDQNNEISQAQALPSLPILVNGQIFQGDRDIFRFAAKAGQTIVCEVQGRKLVPYIADAVPGWLQASLTLYDSTGKELAYVDDYRFHPDPLLIYHVPKDGQYLVEIRDVLFRGREDLVYRLSLGALPYLTHIFPLGAKRDSTAQVQLFGVNLPPKQLSLTIPADSPPERLVTVTDQSFTSNALPFAVGDLPEMTETEPNDSLQQANTVTLPITVNARIGQCGDEDYFLLNVPQRQTLVLEVFGRRLESPIDSVITILNPQGRELRENDDFVDPEEQLITHHADSRLVYSFRAPGDYLIRVKDVQCKGGEEYAYRLVVRPLQPDFHLQVLPDDPRVGQGGTAVITVNALRKDGFNGAIQLAVQNLPEGFVASDAVIAARQNDVRLTITAPADASPGLFSPTIQGTATIGDKQVTRTAVPVERAMQAFIYYHNLPTEELLVSVTAPPALVLSTNVAAQHALEVQQGRSAEVAVHAVRNGQTKGAIRLTTDRPPRGITVRPATIPADRNEAIITVTTTKQAPVGSQFNLIVTGSIRVGRQTIAGVAPAVPIKVVAPQPAASSG